ncbi:IS3 family transposase [Spongiactinospora sp. 9N601]|uniref:IS3 family transposase n=1 Tax=Spongiactinospora sp. 9N601 TaxID=3375149 RepID=UPI00378A6677
MRRRTGSPRMSNACTDQNIPGQTYISQDWYYRVASGVLQMAAHQQPGTRPVSGVFRPALYYAAKRRPPSTRAVSDAELDAHIQRIHAGNYGVYGARKVWQHLLREGHRVARCTVERRMRVLGLQGARPGKKIRTTTSDPGHDRAADRLRRYFTATRANAAWVADFTHVTAWCGVVYVAIVGCAASPTKHTTLVLDALDMALWRRARTGHPAGPGLIHHSDAGSQYTSFRFTTRLPAAGIDASIGTVGDALDNALMESQIGLYKTEPIKPRGPWRRLADVELATAEWVSWFNPTRLHSAIGHLPPDEFEAIYYAQRHPHKALAINR